jgi:hypothetical protein
VGRRPGGQNFHRHGREARRFHLGFPREIASIQESMIRKLKSGEYRLYSRKKNPKTGKRRNLGTFSSLEKAKAHERAVQFFKRQ